MKTATLIFYSRDAAVLAALPRLPSVPAPLSLSSHLLRMSSLSHCASLGRLLPKQVEPLSWGGEIIPTFLLSFAAINSRCFAGMLLALGVRMSTAVLGFGSL